MQHTAPSRRGRTPPPPGKTSPSDESIARLAWAIAHPIRVRILRLLLGRSSCVCGEIVDELPLAQSTVSQHLKILKESGLIQGQVDGPRVCYCVDRDRLLHLKSLLDSLCGCNRPSSATGCQQQDHQNGALK